MSISGPQSAQTACPPEEVPKDLFSDYTLGGAIPVEKLYFNQTSARPAVLTLSEYDKVFNALESRTFKYYGPTCNWLLDALAEYPVLAKNVAVFGALRVNCDAIALFSGAQNVDILEYNVVYSQHPNVSTHILRDALSGSIRYDAAISISSFEHDGLGRYGDPLNPDGDKRAMHESGQLLAENGLLYLAIPVGRDCLVWNAHRIYGRIRLPYLLDGWDVVATFGFQEKLFELPIGKYVQPVFVLRKQC